MNLDRLFDFTEKGAVVTGGAGVLCSTMARALSICGARMAILDINLEGAERVASQLRERGGEAIAIKVDVLDRTGLEEAARQVIDAFGRCRSRGSLPGQGRVATSDHGQYHDCQDAGDEGPFSHNPGSS